MKASRAGRVALFAVLLSGVLISFFDGSERSFPDVSEGSWYYDAVMEMAAEGIFTGYPDGRFGPEDTISVGQFVTIAARCALLEPMPAARCSSEHWAAGACEAALAAGWFEGDQVPASGEAYDQPISRKLAVQILMNSVVPEPWNWPDEIQTVVVLEEQNLSPMEAQYISRGIQAGIIEGDENGVFYPDDALTRAEACTMLRRILSQYGYPVAVTIGDEEVRSSIGERWKSITGLFGVTGLPVEPSEAMAAGGASDAQRYDITWNQVVEYMDYLCEEEGFECVKSIEYHGMTATRHVGLSCVDVVLQMDETLPQAGVTCEVYLYTNVPATYLPYGDVVVPTFSSVVGDQQMYYISADRYGEFRSYLLGGSDAVDLIETYLTFLEQDLGYTIHRYGTDAVLDDEMTQLYAICEKEMTPIGRQGVGINVLLAYPEDLGQPLCQFYTYYNYLSPSMPEG